MHLCFFVLSVASPLLALLRLGQCWDKTNAVQNRQLRLVEILEEMGRGRALWKSHCQLSGWRGIEDLCLELQPFFMELCWVLSYVSA